MPTIINNRYILHESLGGGAMGIVYRATDRLSSNIVAIKSVTILEEDLQFASRLETQADEEIKLALAQEFQTLASLRHPNIISVLDYGFDDQSQPFFTMNYLSNARTVVDAGLGQSTEIRVNLLIQILQALAYLHRRNILHRDLKPENVLVTNDRLRVLDFGLSISRDEAKGRIGTLAYMAPETLKNAQAVEASDLYAVGVIAYQLFSGILPHEPSNIMGILTRPADMAKVEAPQPLRSVIEQLLQKAPSERFDSADSTIAALCKAINQDIPGEAEEIRESFLQAAKFVGRDKELNQLTDALREATNGRGSAWLIGSESGVGKTRLLEELRIRALVQGAQVLRGQANERQGQPYHLWQGPLRRLVLAVELNELEASVLKSIVPDISILLGKEISDAPELNDQEAAQRLILTIANVVQKAAFTLSPLVLLLEDLHWGLENVDSLASLSRIIADIPLLVIATYRTEETPELPDKLPDMQTMLLQRFNPQAIAELSISMLGESGVHQPILTLLQEETEGNAFFLVETVRALAEEAGSLQDIDSTSLPEVVFAGGVHRVIQRRLERVPEKYRPLLKLAAIAGRAIEPEVIHTAMPEVDLENWLTICANVAVLEIHDERWRFAHDKLRERLLDSLSGEESQDLHNQVAQAIEISHKADLSPFYGRLARHYAHAQKQEKEYSYAKLAGEYAASQYSNDEALIFFNQTLELLPEEAIIPRYEVHLACEAIYGLKGELEKRETNLKALQAIAIQLGDKSKEAKINLSWANFHFDRGEYSACITRAQQALDLALAVEEQKITLEACNHIASALQRLNYLDQANRYAKTGLDLARAAKDSEYEARLLTSLGLIAFEKRDLSTARAYFEESLPAALDQGYLRIQANSLNNLGMVAGYQGNFQTAQDYYQQALLIAQKTGARRHEGIILSNLGWVSGLLGKYEQALFYSENNLRIAREINDPYNETYGLINISSYAGALGDQAKALASAEQALQLARQIGDRSAEAWAFTNLGHSHLDTKNFDKAAETYQYALDIRHDLDQPLLATEPTAGLARALLEQNDNTIALDLIQAILPFFALDDGLEGTDDPLRVYLNCYLVLCANNQSIAENILDAAYHLLQERAANIEEPALRHSFLSNIPHHREIMTAWQIHFPKDK